MDDSKKQVFSEESSTGLKANNAGLLCYVGMWISGIVFLIIEKKNTLVRFHAMQSLVCFGILSIVINIADIARGWAIWASHRGPFFPLEIATSVVFGIFVIITIVFWIVLMQQTHRGHFVKVPLFSELALRMLARLDGISKEEFYQEVAPYKGTPEAEQPPPAEESKKGLDKTDSFFRGKRAGRIASYVGAIVWSIALLILFNFFSQYIACYFGNTVNGVTTWHIYPLLTQNFAQVLPIINTALILSIVGHSLAIAFDRYILQEIIKIVLHILGLAAVLTFFRVFPLDFNVIPHEGMATISPTIAFAVLTIIAVVTAIKVLVWVIKLIVNVLK